MPTYSFVGFGLDQLVTTGPNPFSFDNSRNLAAIGNSTIALQPGASFSRITMDDNDAFFQDADGTQDNVGSFTINGTTFGDNTAIETEYSYVIRPVGSTDPAEQITIYNLDINGDRQGIVADRMLQESVTYEIIAGGSDDPSVAYSNLTVCFLEGTAIAVPGGVRAVETLRPGDRVVTLDNGPQEVVWAGWQIVSGAEAHAPVRIDAGVLGNDAPLCLSLQHRVLLRQNGSDLLLPITALVGQPGISQIPMRQARYWHVLLDGHHVLIANGAPAESMYPGPMALRSLPRRDRERVTGYFPDLALGAEWTPARPLMRPGLWRRSQRAEPRAISVPLV